MVPITGHLMVPALVTVIVLGSLRHHSFQCSSRLI